MSLDPSNETVSSWYGGPYGYLISNTHRWRNGYKGPRTYTKLGNLAANPVQFEKTEIRNRLMRETSSNTPVSPSPSKPPDYLSSKSGVTVTDLLDEASKKFYQEAANTNALLPLMLVERQKTIDMVTEKVYKLVALKKRFLKEIKKSWRGNDHSIVQKRWLEYRYGWLPILGDIDNLINKPLGIPGSLVKVGAIKRYESSGHQEGGWDFSQNGTIRVSVQALLIAKDPFQKTASQYGIANSNLIAWELMPYSFVADWIFSIGGYLEHLGALNGLEMINPTHSWRHSFHQEAYIEPRHGLTSGYGSYKGYLGGRALGVPAYPNPFVPNNGMNIFRFLDAAALLKEQFDRIRK